MVAQGSGWIEGMRAAGWQIQRCIDRDAYTVRGPNPEREGDFVVFEVTGMAVAGARTVQELVDHMFNMMRDAVRDAARVVVRGPAPGPQMVMRGRQGGQVRAINVDEVMRQQYAPAIEQMFEQRAVDVMEQPALRKSHSSAEMIEAEVKAKLYLKDLIGAEQLMTYCDSHLIGLKAGDRGWLIGNVSHPGQKAEPAWAPEVAIPRSSEITTYCINCNLTEWLPFTDQVIALALTLMAKPVWFYREANTIDTAAMDHSLNPARFILQ